MSNRARPRKKTARQSELEKSASNSLDWDSPSNKTGTVKRRPASGDSFADFRDECWGSVCRKNQRRRSECQGRDDSRRDDDLRSASSVWDKVKCGPERRPHRSVSVCDPSTAAVGVLGGDVGQTVADNGRSLSGDPGLAPRHIKVLSLDASQARIRYLQHFVENKYVVYKKDKVNSTRNSAVRRDKVFSEKNEEEKVLTVRPVQCTRRQDQTANDNNYLSKPICHSRYPADTIRDPGDGKRSILNGDFPQENEYLIETNCSWRREAIYGGFKIGDGEGDLTVGVRGDRGRGDGKSYQEYNGGKTGKVSDTDSGIASPLSPGSVYGILGCMDNAFKKYPLEVCRKVEGSQQGCCCAEERSQVGVLHDIVESTL